MSQNDFSIANADGQTVLNDLNDALQALASQSKGASAPSTTYSGQVWWDTTNNLLKIRNDGNNGWITWASFDGSTFIPYRSGTALGTAATKDIGTADNEVPQNSDLTKTSVSVLNSDFDATSVSYGDVSQLQVAVESGETWYFEFTINHFTVNSTELTLGVNGPSTSTLIVLGSRQSDNNLITQGTEVNSYDTDVIFSSTGAGTVSGLITMTAYAVFTNSGTFTLRAKRSSGSNTARIKSSSSIKGFRL